MVSLLILNIVRFNLLTAVFGCKQIFPSFIHAASNLFRPLNPQIWGTLKTLIPPDLGARGQLRVTSVNRIWYDFCVYISQPNLVGC